MDTKASSEKKIIVYGAFWCSDCRRTKLFLDQHHIAYDWINIEINLEAESLVKNINDGKRIIPTIIFPDGTIFVEPSNQELADKLEVDH